MMTFLPHPKNAGSKRDFLVLLNALVGVHKRVKNLLTRIGIQYSTFCDRFLLIFILFENYDFQINAKITDTDLFNPIIYYIIF